ncbi:MAG TPA: glycosyl hydrolase [Rhodocyclaceae bacterium]
MRSTTTLLIGTRKGAWTLDIDAGRAGWALAGPLHLGTQVFHYLADPRNPALRLIAEGGGHLGPSVFRSTDGGRHWQEASHPPQFAAASDGAAGRSVDHVFWLTPGHPSQPQTWYAGTSPQALFRSDDGGDTWQEVSGLNDHPEFIDWRGGDKGGTPDGPKLHSIIVDPQDPRHVLVAMSSGGVFESWDEAATWAPLNQGVAMDFAPPREDGSEYPYGHDPHCVVMHPADSNLLYQQNHCGIYRLDRRFGERWQRIGNNMPAEIGDVGFPLVVHPRATDTAWVCPMDGSGLWPRTSPGGKPAVYCTRDGGASWHRQDTGFPAQQAWWTVKRQAMTCDDGEPLGLYLGTTNGQVWASFDEGEHWQCLVHDLPHVYSLSVVPA